MEGKNKLLIKFSALSLGIEPEILQQKISCCQNKISNYDKMQFIEIGIPCRDFTTKDELMNYILEIGKAYMRSINKNNFYLASRAIDRFTRCVNKEFSRKIVEKLL